MSTHQPYNKYILAYYTMCSVLYTERKKCWKELAIPIVFAYNVLTRENTSVKIVVCYDKKYTHEYKYAKYRRQSSCYVLFVYNK